MKNNVFGCLILILFANVFYVFHVDAHEPGAVHDEFVKQDGKYKLANEADKRLMDAQTLMGRLADKYDANKEKIRNGTEVLLSGVFTTVASVSLTYVTGGSTTTVMVPGAISSLVDILGLAGSVNDEAELLSAYESAISETESRIETAKAAVKAYKDSWNVYNNFMSTHHTTGPHSQTPSDRHTVALFIKMTPNYGLPSFLCGGTCNQSFPKPTSPHKTKCSVCPVLYYNCDSNQRIYHEGRPCTRTVTKNHYNSEGIYTVTTNSCPTFLQHASRLSVSIRGPITVMGV